MWKLTELKIKNIVSFHEASLAIKQGVATLIFGKNEDNVAQPCNGSGKSSLVEAISFALTGEQLRKVKTLDEIINDDAEEAMVSLKLTNDYDGVQMTIKRRISRNAPQIIQVLRQTGPYDEDVEEIVQPTVLDYNKYILGEIGLTKEDIYNNYILCDNKYEGFFDSSDRSKKEIINTFSNGVLVDESIAKLQSDIVPAEIEMNQANDEVIKIKGSIAAIENELLHVDEKLDSARKEREEQVNRINEQIHQCRQNIEVAEGKKDRAQTRLDDLADVRCEIAEMEESNMSLSRSYDKIKALCDEYELGEISDYNVLFSDYSTQLKNKETEASGLRTEIRKVEKRLESVKDYYAEKLNDFSAKNDTWKSLDEKDKQKVESIDAEIREIDKQIDEISRKINDNKSLQYDIESKISRDKTILNGAIECPKCKHRFLLDEESTIEEIELDLKALSKSKDNIAIEQQAYSVSIKELDGEAELKSKEADAIEDRIKNRKREHDVLQDEIRELQKALNDAENHVLSFHKKQTIVENDLDKLNGKIECLKQRLFSEISSILENRISSGKDFLQRQSESITYYNGQITERIRMRKELIDAPETDLETSLNKSLKQYQDSLDKANKTLEVKRTAYNELKQQEIHFTMFKSYMANKKIGALSMIVNDFLEKIGSDIRVRLEGFTMTKAGKLRDKISVQVMRDGVDCGSYHKFSGGEKARLNLACILSLHTLTNSNCDKGKGLDFLIIDELLDKSDEMGMSTYCEALNKLGQTALLITQGSVSEGYPHKLLVVKKQGVSTIY